MAKFKKELEKRVLHTLKINYLYWRKCTNNDVLSFEEYIHNITDFTKKIIEEGVNLDNI